MSLYTTPILYLNMGGEMLYVLRQRLAAQGIDSQKSIQVLDDVTAAMLNPKIVSTVFEPSPPLNIASLRSTLESVTLSSIMRLDKASMNKLFDLMIMMTKYQLTVSTGPREVVLLTLNHIDAMREVVADQNGHECINMVHNMMVELYSNMTHGQIWQMRDDCLNVLSEYSVRVSVLLRLGLQNSDTTFNVWNPAYNEKYMQYQDVLKNVKLSDTTCENCTIGSFALFGDRATILGKNIYSASYGQVEHFTQVEEQLPKNDDGIRSELRMLEAQLGADEPGNQKIFMLSLFTEKEDNDADTSHVLDSADSSKTEETKSVVDQNLKSNQEYKTTLGNMYAGFMVDEQEKLANGIDLLQLLDEVQ